MTRPAAESHGANDDSNVVKMGRQKPENGRGGAVNASG
jgi:hypothetical protein